MKLNRLTLAKYFEGREAGGVIIGKWNGNKAEIPHGGLTQLPNWSINKQSTYKPPWSPIIIILTIPRLIKLQRKDPEYRIIGLWHSHPNDNDLWPSGTDMKTKDRLIKRFGGKMAMGIVSRTFNRKKDKLTDRLKANIITYSDLNKTAYKGI